MSNASYSLNNKSFRLISSEDAWIKTKNGKYKLNPKYHFVGKVEMTMPNMIVTAIKKVKQKEP